VDRTPPRSPACVIALGRRLERLFAKTRTSPTRCARPFRRRLTASGKLPLWEDVPVAAALELRRLRQPTRPPAAASRAASTRSRASRARCAGALDGAGTALKSGREKAPPRGRCHLPVRSRYGMQGEIGGPGDDSSPDYRLRARFFFNASDRGRWPPACGEAASQKQRLLVSCPTPDRRGARPHLWTWPWRSPSCPLRRALSARARTPCLISSSKTQPRAAALLTSAPSARRTSSASSAALNHRTTAARKSGRAANVLPAGGYKSRALDLAAGGRMDD